ncbi:MAG: UDP-N-acetylglucosamine 2-epimerase (non-hydrolyzing) [Bernardetiaceae bacterium]|jgi:UDP-GlcNAc3NAcA epimerase|nr:UDP-N-acetylglucosamine 2-epimerase (non-hydrolyzing) [Bernardetiaceae bacterium]
MPINLTTILGARPQFIKAAALSRQIARRSTIREVIVHTGQHYDANMSDVFFREMGIPAPAHFLGINGLGHGAMTGQMLEQIEKVLMAQKPDYVLVYGDTNSTLAGALAAKKLHLKVIHVEAGLRSFNLKMPEEVNRILTDRISDILFCPTQTAVQQLMAEGFANFGCQVVNAGDIMYDSALYYRQQALLSPSRLPLPAAPFALCTIHRAENTDQPEQLTSIFSALHQLAQHMTVVMPLHPRTRKLMAQHGVDAGPLHLLEPVGYLDMLRLLDQCDLVLTDSGGLQKEAFFFNKFCLTLRQQTEWVELVENNYNFVVGTNPHQILDSALACWAKPFPPAKPFYGHGNTAAFICDFIEQYHQNQLGTGHR